MEEHFFQLFQLFLNIFRTTRYKWQKSLCFIVENGCKKLSKDTKIERTDNRNDFLRNYYLKRIQYKD